MNKTAIGKKLKELRVKKKYTITTLADLSHVSQPFISQIESGKRIPSADVLKKLGLVLDASIPDLLLIAGHIDENAYLDELSFERMKLEKQLATRHALYHELHENLVSAVKENEKNALKKRMSEIEAEIHSMQEKLHTFQRKIYDTKKSLDQNSSNKSDDEFLDPFEQNVKERFISFKVPMSKEEVDKNGVLTTFEITPEESRQQFLYLENLFTMDEDIYLNKIALSQNDKERALKILKLVFEDESDHE